LNATSVLKVTLLALTAVGCSYSNDGDLLESGAARHSHGGQGSTNEDNVVMLQGEEANSGSKSGGTQSGGTAAESSGTTPGGTSNDAQSADFATRTLARALQWVDVKMPYCGGVNGGGDAICGGTCRRTGNDASPIWDPYRTDCSGFVSWAWGLAAPGRTTTGFAPFNKDITSVINVDDLQPGDALNNASHVILFGGWANAAHTQARLLEEYDCGEVAVDRIRDVRKVNDTQLSVPGGTFNAIRLDSREVPVAQ
jgi:hypothetical protein